MNLSFATVVRPIILRPRLRPVKFLTSNAMSLPSIIMKRSLNTTTINPIQETMDRNTQRLFDGVCAGRQAPASHFFWDCETCLYLSRLILKNWLASAAGDRGSLARAITLVETSNKAKAEMGRRMMNHVTR